MTQACAFASTLSFFCCKAIVLKHSSDHEVPRLRAPQMLTDSSHEVPSTVFRVFRSQSSSYASNQSLCHMSLHSGSPGVTAGNMDDVPQRYSSFFLHSSRSFCWEHSSLTLPDFLSCLTEAAVHMRNVFLNHQCRCPLRFGEPLAVTVLQHSLSTCAKPWTAPTASYTHTGAHAESSTRTREKIRSSCWMSGTYLFIRQLGSLT